MTSTFSRVTIAAGVLLFVLAGPSVATTLDCSGTQFIGGSQTLSTDWQSTSTAPCFSLSGGAILNLGGHTITCNRPAGCGSAIVETGLATVKNGFIVSGSGNWNRGADRVNKVQNVTIDGAAACVYAPLTSVTNNVLSNCGTACILSNGILAGSNLAVSQNFCSSQGTGFSLDVAGAIERGQVTRNYIRATGTGIFREGAPFDVEQNIIAEAATPIDDNGTPLGLSENLCSDATACPDPGSNFSMTLNFNP